MGALTTTVKNFQGTGEITIAGAVRGKRIIFVDGDIDDNMAMDFVRQVTYFSLEDAKKPIKVFISSNGGSIEAGLVMYDVIQASRVPIIIFCVGKAYSMGAVLLACGGHGRYILPHSRAMIHEPLIQSGVGGKTSSIQTLSQNMLKTKKDMDELLAKHTGQPVEKIESITREDHYFSAEEAVEFGLADKVIDFAAMLDM